MKLKEENPTISERLENYVQQVGHEFRNMHEYISASAKLFNENKQQLLDQKKVALEAIKEHDPADIQIEGYQYDMEIEYYDKFQNVMMNNAFVGAVSLFEVLLKNLCEIFVDESKITPDEINARSYTEKSRKFLTKVVGIDLTENNDDWASIREHIDVRNIIVHQNATVRKIPGKEAIEQHKDYKRIMDFPGIEIVFESETSAYFTIQNIKVIIEFCELSEKYLEVTMDKLGELINK